jgi:uncharacterized membrane protein
MQETSRYNLVLCINPLRTALVLGSTVIGLAAAHALVHLWSYTFGLSSEQMLGLKRFFDMGTEANLPTYVSALNLLLAGALLALIARYESRRQGKQNLPWWGLAIGFVLMSFDEAAMIHEGLVGAALVRYFGRGEGILYFTWYKLYIPIVLLVGLLYVRFLLRLPLRYSLRLLLAGVVFLSGAIGFEMLESYVASHGLRGRSVSQLFEETGEMLGVVLAIHALLLYLADNNVDLLLRVRQQSKSHDADLLRAENEDGLRLR